mmetsp:Transcript_11461/g.27017  ORF Transcript_11461/g.27017 Transcript_11461/m.27017 type:complete len:105 (+) Transcript_11461:467-781(+)
MGKKSKRAKNQAAASADGGNGSGRASASTASTTSASASPPTTSELDEITSSVWLRKASSRSMLWMAFFASAATLTVNMPTVATPILSFATRKSNPSMFLILVKG